MRFEKKDDHYLDIETGLEWTLENFGPFNWGEAMVFCKALKGGWRLPSIRELQTLIDTKIRNPVTELPSMLSSYYWSTTPADNNTNNVGLIDFHYGHYYYEHKYLSRYVRAVREGEKNKNK